MLLHSNRQLPVELLDKIITEVLHNSVHAVCTSSDDVQWEINVVGTLSGVSNSFKSIATEVACKAFELQEHTTKHPSDSLLPEIRKIMMYLRQLGRRLRHPSEWEGVNFQSIECPLSSLVLGYALYLSSVSLRRNSSHANIDMIESTYHVTHSALTQSISLCDRISPTEMSRKLRTQIDDEILLANLNHDIAQGAQDLALLLSMLKSETPSVVEDRQIQKGEEVLEKIGDAEKRYRALTIDRPLDPKAYEIRNVVQVIRDFKDALETKETSILHIRFDEFMREWSNYCPFVTQKLYTNTVPHD